MASRSILGLISTAEGLRKLGEDIVPVLARHGIDLDHVDPLARIERARELAIYIDMAEVLRDPLAGLKAGTNFGIGSYGPFTMLVMTCPTAWEAFRTGIRYQQLTYLFGTIGLRTGTGARAGTTAVVITPLPLPGAAFRFRVDGELSGTWKLVRDLQTSFGLDLSAESIDMPYPKPPEARAYEEQFGCPVNWGETEARCWIRNEHLQVHLPTADAAAHQYFRAQCDQLLMELTAGQETSATDKVRGHLQLFAGQFPDIATVAGALGTSERTLRRQLGQEGSSFRAVLDEVRHAKARHLLANTDQSIDAISQQLGYAESASFIHAFQRWAGETPAGCRRRLRG
ncbi:MAG: AraC family transcriptional regulator ligand-binding domain-containing protein [Pseudomonadota bacterium]